MTDAITSRTGPEPQPGILDISPYVGGKSTLGGHDRVIKLSSNENPFGPPPAAVTAMQATLASMHRYPSTDHAALRGAIGEVHGLDPARIILGVGSDEILTLLAQAYAGPGDEVLFTEHGFSIYRIVALAAGATPVAVPEAERVTDVDALVARAGPETRLCYIANPNNPTGTMIGLKALEDLARRLPETCLMVLDGAYAEFVAGYDGGAALIDAHPNVVMTRTFSKIYGLGGLRVGWGYGSPKIIDVLNRIRGPFNLSSVALAGAEAAVRDQGFVEECRNANAADRARLLGGLRQLGLACDESFGNFILARAADVAEADAIETALARAGIVIRRVGGYGFPTGLRISVGTPDEVSAVISALTAWRSAA
ncbi:MAG: histidinol-phosphate transaminase [Pseudomonadota bacterium]